MARESARFSALARRGSTQTRTCRCGCSSAHRSIPLAALSMRLESTGNEAASAPLARADDAPSSQVFLDDSFGLKLVKPFVGFAAWNPESKSKSGRRDVGHRPCHPKFRATAGERQGQFVFGVMTPGDSGTGTSAMPRSARLDTATSAARACQRLAGGRTWKVLDGPPSLPMANSCRCGPELPCSRRLIGAAARPATTWSAGPSRSRSKHSRMPAVAARQFETS